jgi:hypothetical protein
MVSHLVAYGQRRGNLEGPKKMALHIDIRGNL